MGVVVVVVEVVDVLVVAINGHKIDNKHIQSPC